MMGWRLWDSIWKTTNGGINWISQTYPQPYGSGGGIRKFSVINKDTIWGSYPHLIYPNTQMRGLLYRTTNGGNNWYYQIPDTTFRIGRYPSVQFINKYTGWAGTNSMIHTTVGGDTTFLSSIHQISNKVPNEYKLYQNYPNPFNPVSSIRYQVSRSAEIKLLVFDISGKEIKTLVNNKQTSGSYEVTFDGSKLSSGIYFYTLFVDGVRVDTKKAVLIK